MLKNILSYLSVKIELTNYFEKIFPLAKIITDGDKTYPAEFLGKGNYKSVNNFDHYNGMAYFRQTGKEIISKFEDEIPVCDLSLRMEYPMRLVACVPNSKLECDDIFADEKVATSILKAITLEGGLIKSDIKAQFISSIPSSVEKDNLKIISEEYNSVAGFKDVNYKFSYCAIDFNIILIIKTSCIDACEETYS